MKKTKYIPRFSKEDLEGLDFKIFDLEEFIWDSFQEFNTPSYKADDPKLWPEHNSLLKYVIFLRSKFPFSQIKDLALRKVEALHLAGLEGHSRKADILNGQYAPLQHLETCYLIDRNDKKFELLISLEEAFHRITAKLRKPIDDDLGSDKEKAAYAALNDCRSFSKEMLKDYEALLNEITDIPDLKESVAKEAAKQVGNTPIELMLSKISGEDVKTTGGRN